jgi:hypothetical protein
MSAPIVEAGRRDPWNKGELVGQRATLKLSEIWAIRVRLELGDRNRELALFMTTSQTWSISFAAWRGVRCAALG